MKTLLTAIQTALQDAAGLNYVTRASIYITPDEALFYISKSYPQIAITDGPIEHTVEESEVWQRDLEVGLAIYQELKPEDQSILGNDAPLIYGVLDIADDIHSVLFDNHLGISDIEVALPTGETEGMFVEAEDISIIKKVLYYNYTILEANPS